MSHLLKIALALCLISVFSNCSKDMSPCEPDNLVNPLVIIDSLTTQGNIRIYCEIGPYYFNIDSIKTHCQADTLTNEAACLYDNNNGMLGSAENHHFSFGYNTPMQLNLHPNFSYLSIDTLHFYQQNDMLIPFGQHPYYGGFIINKTNEQFKIWYTNTYVGGCLHDMVIWESVVF